MGDPSVMKFSHYLEAMLQALVSFLTALHLSPFPVPEIPALCESRGSVVAKMLHLLEGTGEDPVTSQCQSDVITQGFKSGARDPMKQVTLELCPLVVTSVFSI